MRAEAPTIIAGIGSVLLLAQVALVWRERRAPAWIAWMGACVLHVAGVYAVASWASLRYPWPGAALVVLPGAAGVALAFFFGTRWILGAIACLALSALCVWACVFVEAGTHGRWYVRSEGLALLLSLLAGFVPWHAGMGLLLWRGRR